MKLSLLGVNFQSPIGNLTFVMKLYYITPLNMIHYGQSICSQPRCKESYSTNLTFYHSCNSTVCVLFPHGVTLPRGGNSPFFPLWSQSLISLARAESWLLKEITKHHIKWYVWDHTLHPYMCKMKKKRKIISLCPCTVSIFKVWHRFLYDHCGMLHGNCWPKNQE